MISVELILEYIGCNELSDLILPDGVESFEFIRYVDANLQEREVIFTRNKQTILRIKTMSRQIGFRKYVDQYFVQNDDGKWEKAAATQTVWL